MITLYLHIEGIENALVEVERLPELTDTVIIGKNPRRRDGKDLPYVLPEVATLIVPLTRILFIEVMSEAQEDDFETFIRE